MELGKSILRRNGINALSSAIHRSLGLAWTDGRCVYLVPVSVLDDQVQNDHSIKLGEFDQVQSLQWSCDMATFCYLCVVHQSTVSLWKVNGRVPDLQLKQCRKINATPIPQGVLWNPCRDILCILNKDQCSFYFRHIHNKGSYALPPIESGKITSGCWAEDGTKLVIGIGSIILIYQWHDIDKSISEYTIIAWKIPNVEGRICSVCAITDNKMVATAELPLETLCHSANKDMFSLPDWGGEENNLNKDVEGEEEDGMICPMDQRSKGHSLLNLQRSGQPPFQESSQLIVFEIQGRMLEPAKVASSSIKGMLAPDLLYYDSVTETVVVGCNTQNTLLIYQLRDSDIHKIHEIQLDKDDRPKGIAGVAGNCRHSGDGVLVLTGRLPSSDPAFLPASTRTTYTLSLHYYNLIPTYSHPSMGSQESMATSTNGSHSANLFRELHLPNTNSHVHLLRINPLHHGGEDNGCHGNVAHTQNNGFNENNGHFNDGYHDNISQDSFEQGAIKRKNSSHSDLSQGNLVLPSNHATQAGRSKIMVLDGHISEAKVLETECVDFSDYSPRFASPFDEITPEKKQLTPEAMNLVESLPHMKNKLESKTVVVETLEPPGGVLSGGHVSSTSECNGYGKGYQQNGRDVDLCSTTSSDRELNSTVTNLQSQIQLQSNQICSLQDRIEQIAKLLDDTACVPSTKYQPAEEPEVLHLVWRSDDTLKTIKKSFVLDSGRLQLEPVKQAFGLSTVELLVDETPCVLGANVDGYIPIRFKPQTTMTITGKRIAPIPEPRSSMSTPDKMLPVPERRSGTPRS